MPDTLIHYDPSNPALTFDPYDSSTYTDVATQHAIVAAQNAQFEAAVDALVAQGIPRAVARSRVAPPVSQADMRSRANATQLEQYAKYDAENAANKAATEQRIIDQQRARLAGDLAVNLSAILPPANLLPDDLEWLDTGPEWRDKLDPIVRMAWTYDPDESRSRWQVERAALWSDYTIRDAHTGRVIVDLAATDGVPKGLWQSTIVGSRRRGGVYGIPWAVGDLGVRTVYDGENVDWATIDSTYRRLRPEVFDAGGVILSGTATPSTVPTANAGVSPSMIATYQDPSGSQQTVDGTGKVISAAGPDGYFDVHTAPEPSGYDWTVESAGSSAPVLYVPPHVDVIPGGPATVATPGTTAGTATDPVSATVVTGPPQTLIDGTPISDAKVPSWLVVVGVIGALYLVMR